MDDDLEQPSPIPPSQLPQEEENGNLSGGEDEGPDWTRLKSFASSSRTSSLPKRGDKEFEPAAGGPTKLQAHSLDRAREAMFGALDGERGTSNKSISYAVWYPGLSRAHVTQARGVLFDGIGHSVSRPASDVQSSRGNKPRTHKRTELLPEETLYLIERGSLFCWKEERNVRVGSGGDELGLDGECVPEEQGMCGSPMSVQQAYADMIGRDDLTLERYQAYAYLKRLGFKVLRANPPSPSYPTPGCVAVSRLPPSNPIARLFNPFMNLFSRLRHWLFGKIDWWRPLRFGWLGCARNYASVYRTLRIIPSGHNVRLHTQVAVPELPDPPRDVVSTEQPTPYEIFYHVYKPNTPFRKSAPPPPDYSLVVVNARTTPLPSLHELTYLWSFLPETGPPPPRQRMAPNSARPPPTSQPKVLRPPRQTLFTRLFPWLSRLGLARNEKTRSPPPRKPHPFAVLKGGKKTIVVGVVDCGTVGFFRFSMGAFEEMPMI